MINQTHQCLDCQHVTPDGYCGHHAHLRFAVKDKHVTLCWHHQGSLRRGIKPMKHNIHRTIELTEDDIKNAVLYWLHNSEDKPTPRENPIEAVKLIERGRIVVDWSEQIESD